MSQTVLARLERIARATAAKLAEQSPIRAEYEEELEQVGPSPGQPGLQHDTMVSPQATCHLNLELSCHR